MQVTKVNQCSHSRVNGSNVQQRLRLAQPGWRRPRLACGASPRTQHPDAAIELRNGAVVEGPSLAVNVNGLQMPNPFVIGSGEAQDEAK